MLGKGHDRQQIFQLALGFTLCALAAGCGDPTASGARTSWTQPSTLGSYDPCDITCTSTCGVGDIVCGHSTMQTCEQEECGCPSLGATIPCDQDHCAFEPICRVGWFGLRVTMTWTDDGQLPQDSDNDGINDAFCGDHIRIHIEDPVDEPEWRLGLVRSADDPEATEACRNPNGDAICHAIGQSNTITQVSSCDPTLLQSGATTLLDASAEPTMGWYLEDPHGFCFVGGPGKGFWDGLGCVEIQ